MSDYNSTVYDLFGEPFFDPETPVQFRLFDPKICGELQEEWLASAVEQHGIARAELDAMIASMLLRRWKDGTGKEGFLLYTEQQARIAKKLQMTGRYSEAELVHVFTNWNDYLQTLSVDDFAYDNMDEDDYENFRWRTHQMTDFFAKDLARLEDPIFPFRAEHWFEDRKATALKRHAEWSRTRDYLAIRTDADLTPSQRERWRKTLHQLQFSDEWGRLAMAQVFAAQIEQGYSVEISFRSGETANFDQTTFKGIDWPWTLSRFKETRNEGKVFPLRTPDFNLTENGLQLLNKPSPEAYKALHEKYALDELFTLLDKKGPSLWECDLAASGRAACAECGTTFERTTASRQYCSERCRSRAKSRRWRENDPERARMAQARHYREAYPDG